MSYGLSGNAVQSNGTAASKVFVREWDNGRSLGYATPDVLGDWGMKGLNPIKTYEATAHGASGYQPIAHGPLSPVLVTDTPLIDLQFGASNTAFDAEGYTISSASNFTTESDGSTASGYRFVGSSTAQVQFATDNAFRPLTGQFALVCEVYVSSFPNSQVLVDTRPTVYNSYGVACYISATTGYPAIYGNGGVSVMTATTSVPTNQWVELVFQRRDTNTGGVEIYMDGVKLAQTGTISSSLTDNAFKAFRQQDNANSFIGKCRRMRWYIGELYYA